MPPKMSEFDSFAKYLGLEGSDVDVFYEAYYDLDPEEYEIIVEEDYEY